MLQSRLICHVALILLATSGVACAARKEVRPQLRWLVDPASPGQATVEADGVDWNALAGQATDVSTAAGAARVLRVYAGRASSAASPLPAMLGAYELKDGLLRFRPTFPLEPGMRYEAVLELGGLPAKPPGMLQGVLTAEYISPPRPEAPPTLVFRVYPTAAELPENLLKFYVHFSAPMSRGYIYRHVHLINDAAGREVELPFLELEEELWNPAMTRVTLFIDPGRIKRGVRPLEEVGPALETSKRYTLAIDQGLLDATGRELGQPFRKAFAVAPPLREAPDPAKWTVTPPTASTRSPLTIDFPHPMDYALAERLIRVVDSAGRALSGGASLGDDERRWAFTPTEPWAAGRYEIVVQPTVEDLAGNNVGKLFEVDLQQNEEGRPELSPVRLAVEVR